MILKSRISAGVVGCFILVGIAATAQKPERNVSGVRHPNLASAQQLSRQAWNKIVAAQQANEWDLKGHAQKAKNLLDEVNQELKLAAEVSNQNGH